MPHSSLDPDGRVIAPKPTSTLFALVAFAAVIAAQAFSILTSPAEGDMAHLQKIMYVHLPAAWMAFISFFIVLVFSLRYLWKRRENDALLAASAAEGAQRGGQCQLPLNNRSGRIDFVESVQNGY